MRAWNHWMKTFALTAAVLAASPALSLADRVWTKAPNQPNAKPFERKDLKIQKIEAGKLVFRVITSDRVDARDLGEIWQIEADGEPRLNAAEAAFATGDFAKATGEYQSAVDGSKAAWVKLRAATRLIESATNAKNFTAAVKGYGELVKIDPAVAPNFRPAIPAGAPGSLAPAVAEAKRAATAAGATAAQKEQLLTLALELARANGDNKEASAIAELLTGAAGEQMAAANTTPNTTTGGNAAAAGDANRRIQLAMVAIGNKQFDQALKQINGAPEVFTEPSDQVEALFCLAEAKNGLAKDTESLKDAALDYMRVVARAKGGNVRSPLVPDALYKTAVIHERIRATDEATLLYQQVTAEFADSDAAPKATAALARLEKKAQS